MRRLHSPFVIAAVTGVVALLGLLTYGLVANSPDDSIESALSRGERPPAPAFELPLLGGQERRSLADYRGEVVVLNFWGSWCEPCREESPLLQRWHERIAPRGGTVLGVDALDVTSDALAFVDEFALTYPMLKDAEEAVGPEYGITGYPETFVLDREGRVVALRRGPVDERFLRDEVLPLLRSSG